MGQKGSGIMTIQEYQQLAMRTLNPQLEKKDVLKAFGAHIFFDDQRCHAEPAAEHMAAAVVPYREGDDPTQ